MTEWAAGSKLRGMGKICARLNPQLVAETVSLPGGESLLLFDEFYANPKEVEEAVRRGRRFFNDQGNPQVDAELDVTPVLEYLSQQMPSSFVAGAQNYYAHTERDDATLYVHADEFDQIVLCYLGHPPEPTPGVTFFRHRESGVVACPPKAERLFAELGGAQEKPWLKASADGYVPSAWEALASIEYRYNRCVIFSPRLYHRGEPGWGTSLQDCRLAQSIGLVCEDQWAVRL